jgi:hypothetical protein
MSIAFNRRQATFHTLRSPGGDRLILLDMRLNIAMKCVIDSLY